MGTATHKQHVTEMPRQKPKAGHAATPISQMYARWTLDCVIESSLVVANDFVKRYQQYSGVAPDISEILAELRTKTGYDPSFPNLIQRRRIYEPLLGTSNANASTQENSFQQAAAALRAAAIAYSERVYDTGEQMLRDAFADAVDNFSALLSTLAGGVVDDGNQKTEAIFGKSVAVLANSDVAHAFGLRPAPAAPWPFHRKLNGDGAYLIEEVTRTLQPSGVGTISQEQFLALQQVAASGEEVLQRVQADRQGDLTELITQAYRWATALTRVNHSPTRPLSGAA